MTNGKPVVIKMGGNDLAKSGFIPRLAAIVAERQKKQPCILIHGGGRAIDDLLSRLEIEPRYVDGQRVTDGVTLEAAEMVLSGVVNKRLVLALTQAGIDALGMSGVDRGLLRVEAWAESMGLVGRIVEVRKDVLLDLCASGVVPVISPISVGPDGRYNVNADHAAGAIAGAVGADSATFLTNVPGVLINDRVVPKLSAEQTNGYIEQGVINGGMIPKVEAALGALSQGVGRAIITDLDGLHAGTGTTFVLHHLRRGS